ncbi:MAG: 3-phosphoshikimate 1-carboxyvinyltransferase [Gammaproteobacteria bacterium]|nr:3-phosphoshikimate 1-carboxyvinyltransferase [Gammaproteobacteria bacterium]
MMRYKISHSKLSGSVIAPPSKSHTLRAILFASMAQGSSKIFNYLKSPDTQAMLDACQKLGAHIKQADDLIEIIGVAGKPRIPDDVINAGNSGQVLRFIAAIAALTDGHVVLTGDHSVRFNRPVTPLMKGLSDLGARCATTKNDDHAPIIISGPIASGHAVLDGADSQPVSALLIASAFLHGTTTIHVENPGETPWVGLTLAWFDTLGIQYSHTDYADYIITGGSVVSAFEYTVPGDFSSIAYPIVAALITQSHIKIKNIDMLDAQGDKQLIQTLQNMGAKITVEKTALVIHPSGQLIGCDIDVNDFIDALPILAVVGCYAKGTTRLLNAGIARKKESDRLAAITLELNQMGANIIEQPDALIIQEAALHETSLNAHHDHRIAMSLTIAALGCKMQSTVHGALCIKKSYPDFFENMKSLGCSIEILT